MAGPACSVLLPALDDETEARIERGLDAAGWPKDRRNGELIYDVCAIDDGPEQYSVDELEQLASKLGWRPVGQIVLCSMIGTKLDYHRSLARGAAILADELGGVIDLDGILGHAGERVGEPTPLEITYQVEAGRSARYWVVSADWLRRWLLDSEFRMVQ